MLSKSGSAHAASSIAVNPEMTNTLGSVVGEQNKQTNGTGCNFTTPDYSATFFSQGIPHIPE